jgi:hypothetical protein
MPGGGVPGVHSRGIYDWLPKKGLAAEFVGFIVTALLERESLAQEFVGSRLHQTHDDTALIRVRIAGTRTR